MSQSTILHVVATVALLSACAPAPQHEFINKTYNIKSQSEGYQGPDSIFAY